jgi:membrane fusion protein (multidrug efflux system)
MNKKRACISIPLLLLLAACGGKMQKSGPSPGQAALTVKAIVIEPRELEERIQVTGTILANEEVDIRSEISGRVTAINFREDSQVNKGDLLVRINDSELQAQLKRLELEKKLAEDDVFRKTRLLEMNAVSKEEYDVAVNQLGIIEAEIDLIRSQIAKSSIVAPFSGKVGLRMISPGAYVSPSTLITHLQDFNPVKIEFAAQEKYLGQVDKKTLVHFQVEGIDSLFSGRVYAVDPRIDPATRTFMVRASCPNPAFMLIPGAFARVEVFLETAPDALMIPSEAIMPDIRGERVFILEKGRAKGIYIKTGTRTEREVQVVRGLQPSDTVITTGLLQLRENMPLQVRIEDNADPN